ncbi:threonine aldolase 1 isoform X3 [Heptranchias perlo]|uniref:threonine aldolase 1 isoform X3 n=1 Tax=Heptranchias perlo TaxID=212740 RepID=UPI00355A64D7
MGSVLLRRLLRRLGPLPALHLRRYRGAGAPRAGSAPPLRDSVCTVDLRSDTVTRPGPEMRAAMASAEVGDDVYGEDPTVNELQRRAAKLFGMEDALFVPTGTMGNLISVMCHCRERGAELIVGDQAHIHLYEQGGSAQVRDLADTYKLPVHMDGARLMNAAVALGVEPAEIVRHCDSVCMCLSKGLGAPVGSLIGGRKEFIEQALRVRKVLGGGMRQAGVLAAAGLLSISDMVERLKDDHRNTRKFAQGIQKYASPVCDTNIDAVETNILMFTVNDARISPEEFCDQMAEVTEEEVMAVGRGVRVLLLPMYGDTVRAVWHLDVSEKDTDLALQKLQFVIQKVRKK